MRFLGDLLALPIRIANVPFRAIEKMVDPDSELGDEDNVLSDPLEQLAKAIKEIDKD